MDDIECLVYVKVERIGGKITKEEQKGIRSYQWIKAMNCFGLIISEWESKLKGP